MSFTLYLDTSALVKLYIREDGSALMERACAEAARKVTVSISYAEARAALAARYRAGHLSMVEHLKAWGQLDSDWKALQVIEVTEDLVGYAGDLALHYGLRGYDAVQFAGIIGAVDLWPGVIVATWDEALVAALNKRAIPILK